MERTSSRQSSRKNETSFENPLAQHQTPKYDITGMPTKCRPVTAVNIIPQSWTGNKRTVNDMLAERKTAKVPDITYDLDGDGVVSNRDYFFGKMFDKDGDGRLNTPELSAAKTALKEGIEGQFVWGLEGSGANLDQRLKQVRGQVIEGENWHSIAKSYPAYPRPQTTLPKTKGELDEKRKQAVIQKSNELREKYFEANPLTTDLPTYVGNPKGSKPQSNQSQKMNDSNKAAGINTPSYAERNKRKKPSIDYVMNPEFSCKSEMDHVRKKQNLNELGKGRTLQYIDNIERLNVREGAFSSGYTNKSEGLTLAKLQEQRRKELFESNMKKFSNRAIGIHEHELPKYSNMEKDWWECDERY